MELLNLVDELSTKIDDEKDEIKTLKRKHVNSLKVNYTLIYQLSFCSSKTIGFRLLSKVMLYLHHSYTVWGAVMLVIVW